MIISHGKTLTNLEATCQKQFQLFSTQLSELQSNVETLNAGMVQVLKTNQLLVQFLTQKQEQSPEMNLQNQSIPSTAVVTPQTDVIQNFHQQQPQIYAPTQQVEFYASQPMDVSLPSTPAQINTIHTPQHFLNLTPSPNGVMLQ